MSTDFAIGRILMIMLSAIKYFGKALGFAVTSCSIVLFGDRMVLFVDHLLWFVDVAEPMTKIISSMLALTTSGLAIKYGLSKFSQGKEEARKQHIEWLINMGFIEKGATLEEIEEAINTYIRNK